MQRANQSGRWRMQGRLQEHPLPIDGEERLQGLSLPRPAALSRAGLSAFVLRRQRRRVPQAPEQRGGGLGQQVCTRALVLPPFCLVVGGSSPWERRAGPGREGTPRGRSNGGCCRSHIRSEPRSTRRPMLVPPAPPS